MRAMAEQRYMADRSLAIAVFLALELEQPLFLEGEAGVGKTEVAHVLAAALGRPLLRLQCYEGLDRETAVYEWNYPRQVLHIRLLEAAQGGRAEVAEEDLFSRRFLIRRPLLEAIDPPGPAPVLLIDEVDRADEEFEAFLLELLADFQISIPEIGTIRAKEKPVVVLTSNRTREVHDALKRRCLYHWIDYPGFAKELRIVRAKVPGLPEALAEKVCRFVQRLRKEPLFKLPGVAETLVWAKALEALHVKALQPETVADTIGCLLKYRDDVEWVRGESGAGRIPTMLAEADAL